LVPRRGRALRQLGAGDRDDAAAARAGRRRARVRGGGMSVSRPSAAWAGEPWPARGDLPALAREGTVIPICREILADLETPVSAFLKIHRGPYRYLLESVEGREKWGRYSF